MVYFVVLSNSSAIFNINLKVNFDAEKKAGAIFLLILAVPKPLFSVTHHPLHPFLAPKSPVVQH